MSNQWLTGPGGVYGINFVPVLEAARELGINIDRRFLEKLKAFEAAAVSAVTEKKPGCTPEKKAKCLAEFGSVHLDWICGHCEERRDEAISKEE